MDELSLVPVCPWWGQLFTLLAFPRHFYARTLNHVSRGISGADISSNLYPKDV